MLPCLASSTGTTIPVGFSLDDSTLWPEFVDYIGEDKHPTIEGHLKIEPSLRGKLIRVEGGECLIDFGREGHARIPVESTNMLQQMRAIRDGVQVKGWGNAAKILLPGMVYVEGDTLKPYQTELMKTSKDKILILYCRPGRVALDICLAFARAVKKRYSAEDYIIVVLFTELFNEYEVARQLKRRHSDVPFVRNYLSEPLTRSLQHQPKKRVEAICIDKNGKILTRSDWLGIFSNRTRFLSGVLD